VVALLLILTSGHPETLLHCVAGAGVYFLFELGFAGKGRRLRPVLLSLVAGALTLGLSAVLLLPLAEALPHTREQFTRQGCTPTPGSLSGLGDAPTRRDERHALHVWCLGQGEPLAAFPEPSLLCRVRPLALRGCRAFLAAAGEGPSGGARGPRPAMGARVAGIADAVSALPPSTSD
jgi:hypothetical protein